MRETPGSPSVGRLARAMTWAAGGNFASQAIWLVSLLVLGALLPPRYFGSVALGLLITTAATRLMESGTHGSIIVRPELRPSELRRDLVINVVNGALLAGAIALLATHIVTFFGEGADASVLRALSLTTFLYAFSIVPLAVLERTLQFKRRAIVQTGSMGLAAVIAIGMGIAGAGVWALVARQLLMFALQAVFAWVAVRGHIPRDERPRATRDAAARAVARAFLVWTITDYVVFNADYLIVGHLTNATQLGLYSLAFTLAFAPTKQLSSQVGLVLFPAAAQTDPETLARRTAGALRLSSLLLLPAIPVAIVLAPVVIPGVLGHEWDGMVTPFQILVVVGIAHAVTNVIGETLSGTPGGPQFRAWVNVPWMVGMVIGLLLLVKVDGIRGASIAHLALYAPVVLAYLTYGAKLTGLEPRRSLAAVRPPMAAVLVQGAVTAAVWEALEAAGTNDWLAATAAALVGLGVIVVYARTRERDLIDRLARALRRHRAAGSAGRVS